MRFNLNKIFPFLSIRKKLIIAFALLSSIPLLIFGLVGTYISWQSMREVAIENITHDVAILNERAQHFISNVNSDINFLTNNSGFKNLINNKENNENLSNYVLPVTSQMQDFISNSGRYYQIRFIDSESNEMFRIQKIDSLYQIIPNENLSDASFKYYFILTEKVDRNAVSIVPVELIDDKTQTIPAISFAVKLFDDENKFSGLFIADVFVKELFNILEQNIHFDYGQEVVIVNSDGNYLYHSKKKKDWNSLLAHKSEESILEKYPKEFSSAIYSGEPGYISNGYNEIIAYIPLFVTPFVEGTSYFIFEKVNEKYIFAQAQTFAYISFGFILLFLFVSISMGFLATNQIAKPIKELKKGAEIISRGNYSHRLAIRTNDEIEELAYQFNLMAEVLAERDRQLDNHQKKLERTVVERTSELYNEKEKLQVILDNVPSAFLLIDENQNILTASAAISNLANLDPQSIVNKKCSEAFGNNLICDNRTMMNSGQKKDISNFIESRYDSTGDIQFIEHTTIPISLNENKYLTLEILTDITNRKKTEEHLLKLEKLITIGETTALIAHEFRNSLTSVKMLLQLQRETSESNEDIKSLNQSLDSLNRMEKIINNLLRFSRSVSPELKYCSINQIIEESLLFFQPQFRKKNISVQKMLNLELPGIMIDDNLLKESIINLLVNAMQAVKINGKLKIVTDKFIVPSDINDFAYVGKITPGKISDQHKITMNKGSEVIKIELQDNGAGIPKQNLPKIFDPFFTTKSGGSGLGLAMVKRSINQHGGIISVNSSPGSGTTFIILLPIRRDYSE
jgi:PAS domain S-box-containing protein